MESVKIRKQGNSLSVTLDQATLRAANLHEGDRVAPTVRNGVVTLVPVEVRPEGPRGRAESDLTEPAGARQARELGSGTGAPPPHPLDSLWSVHAQYGASTLHMERGRIHECAGTVKQERYAARQTVR